MGNLCLKIENLKADREKLKSKRKEQKIEYCVKSSRDLFNMEFSFLSFLAGDGIILLYVSL